MSVLLSTRYSLRVFFFLAIVLFPVCTRGGTIDPNTPDKKYVEFGRSFPMVARLIAPTEIVIEDEMKKAILSASSVIIKPHWVLTAAHVFEEAAGMPVVIADNHKPRAATFIVTHPAFNPDVMGAHDIALCFVPTPFSLEFYTPLYTDTNELGKAATIAGFGRTGTFKTGAVKQDGFKRAGHNEIDCLTPFVLSCSPSVHNRFPLEFMIAPGDSGGGLFIGDELAGICSFVSSNSSRQKANGGYNNDSSFTRVSTYVPWIDEIIKTTEQHLLTQAQAEAVLE